VAGSCNFPTESWEFPTRDLINLGEHVGGQKISFAFKFFQNEKFLALSFVFFGRKFSDKKNFSTGYRGSSNLPTVSFCHEAIDDTTPHIAAAAAASPAAGVIQSLRVMRIDSERFNERCRCARNIKWGEAWTRVSWALASLSLPVSLASLLALLACSATNSSSSRPSNRLSKQDMAIRWRWLSLVHASVNERCERLLKSSSSSSLSSLLLLHHFFHNSTPQNSVAWHTTLYTRSHRIGKCRWLSCSL